MREGRRSKMYSNLAVLLSALSSSKAFLAPSSFNPHAFERRALITHKVSEPNSSMTRVHDWPQAARNSREEHQQHPGVGAKGVARMRRGLCSMLDPAGEGHKQQTYEVVFVRHGQSTWNKANRFIGWTDTELTEEGEIEARVAGQVLLSEGFEFDVIYTSMLKRAIKTAWVVLDELSQQHVPVVMDWHLNERCYGALVGREKKECVREFGQNQVKIWRRSYDIPPPPIDKSSKLWPGNNPKYNFLMKDGVSQVPTHESLKDVMQRSSRYWNEVLAPAIKSGRRVCVCGHENNLRSLLKYIDGISNEEIINVELPRAVPLVYKLDENLKPIAFDNAVPFLSGVYAGDPEEIAAIMERDLKNVYDLSVSQNLENTDKRFAAKLADLAEPCAVDDFGGPGGEGERDFTGTFLETGVGDDSCRQTDIASTPLFLYNRGQANPKVKATDAEDQSAAAPPPSGDDAVSSPVSPATATAVAVPAAATSSKSS